MQSELPLKYVLVNGIRFAYHEAGSGPLVLCLHGFPDTAQSFTHLLPTLAAAGYRAVAIYMRGYAPTPPAPDGDYSPLSLARDVLGIIEALGVRSADVIGHDWGAYAAYCAANITPSRIRRLVLMSVPHIGGSSHSFKQVFRSWYVMYFQLPNLPEKKVAANNFAFIDKLYKRWSPNWDPSAYDLGPVKKALAAPGGLSAALGYYRAIFLKSTQQAWAVLSAKTVTPTLMIAGEADGSVGPEVFAKSQDAFTGPFELRTLPRVGHFPHREAVDEVEEMILQFLERDLRKSQEGELPQQQRERRNRSDRRQHTDRRQQDDRRHMEDRRLTPGREEYEEELAADTGEAQQPPETIAAPSLTEEQIEAQRLEQERLEQERIRQEEEQRQIELEQDKRQQDEERLERLRLDQIELERRREEDLREEQKRQAQLEEERLRQEEEERQEQLRLEQVEQERRRQEEELLQARLREEQIELEKRQQEEALKLAQLRQQQAERERLRKEEEERQAKLRAEQEEREQQRQEALHKEETRRAQLEQERLRQEQAEQERIRQEQLQQEKFQQEQQRLEQYRQEQLEQDRLQQEQLEQERLRQEQLKQEQLKQEQEKLRREREEMERFRQAQLKYEQPRALSKEEIEKARLEEARKKLAGESDEDNSTPFPF